MKIVIDGPLSGGTPKALELYALETISDLSLYGLSVSNNGGGLDEAREVRFDQQTGLRPTFML